MVSSVRSLGKWSFNLAQVCIGWIEIEGDRMEGDGEGEEDDARDDEESGLVFFVGSNCHDIERADVWVGPDVEEGVSRVAGGPRSIGWFEEEVGCEGS